jgi:hypothetical protein
LQAREQLHEQQTADLAAGMQDKASELEARRRSLDRQREEQQLLTEQSSRERQELERQAAELHDKHCSFAGSEKENVRLMVTAADTHIVSSLTGSFFTAWHDLVAKKGVKEMQKENALIRKDLQHRTSQIWVLQTQLQQERLHVAVGSPSPEEFKRQLKDSEKENLAHSNVQLQRKLNASDHELDLAMRELQRKDLEVTMLQPKQNTVQAQNGKEEKACDL